MIKVTLKDIYKTNQYIPFSLLKQEEEGKLVLNDAMDYKQLADSLVEHRTHFRCPCVGGREPATYLVAGFKSFKLKYLLRVRYRTLKRT